MPEPTPQAAGDSPQQAPMGVSPVTGPTPNQGYEAKVKQGLGVVAKMLADLVPLAGGTSELGLMIGDMLKKVAKYTEASNPNSEANYLQQRQMQNAQQQQMLQQMRGAQMGGQGGGQQQPGGPPMAPRAAA